MSNTLNTNFDLHFQIIENLDLLVLVLDDDVSIKRYNKYLNNIKEINETDKISFLDISAHYQSDGIIANKKLESIRNSLLEEEKVTLVWKYRSSDDKIFEMETTFSYWMDKDKKYLIAISKDISKIQELSDKLVECENLRLEKEKEECLGRLADGIGQELNDILIGIVSYPDLILMSLPDESPLKPHVEKIKQTGETAREIIQDLLTLARRVEIPKTEIELNELILKYQNSDDFTSLRYNNPYIKYNFTLSKEPIFINGSHHHLIKCLSSLFKNSTNSVNLTGNVEIRSSIERVEDDTQPLVSVGTYGKIVIYDNGQYLPYREIQRIFEPFYNKKVMGREGTGLELALVHSIIKEHGGVISVDSERYKGTTYTILLPTSDTINKKLDGDETTVLSLQDEAHVLIIDDVAEQREILSEILSTMGVYSHALPSGEDAILYLQDNYVDLILLDMIMDPGIDGLETYKRVKELRPNQKVIIVTAYAENDRVQEALYLGVKDYVKKPYSVNEIIDAVKKQLRMKK